MEYKNKQRVTEIMKEHEELSAEDMKRLYYAFEKLVVLKKTDEEFFYKIWREAFEQKKEEYKEKMKWINEFVKTKGLAEVIFTNIEDYDACVEDYDYYYEFKTQTQYDKDEEDRKKKMEGQNKETPSIDEK